MEITTVGIDLAKNVFQVHAISSTGEVIVRRALEAGAGDAVLPQAPAVPDRHGGLRHEPSLGARTTALGHEVRLMPPAYVKPYVKRGKTDAADAEAICEAVTRPTMRFVPIKSVEQQAAWRCIGPAISWSGSAPSSST